MTAALTLYRTSIGKKFVMALTGLIGYGYVIAHMVGNLKVFFGAEEFNHYAEFLRTVGEPVVPERTLLWIIRLVLIVAVVAHVVAAVQLTRQDWAGRPVRYAKTKRIQASFASTTLRWGGLALFLFIIFHLLHLTFGASFVHPTFIQGDPYHNLVSGFQNPFMVLIYLLAVGALAMHLFHGVWSLFQTLGINGNQTNGLFRALAIASAVLLFVGFSVVPLAVLLGYVR